MKDKTSLIIASLAFGISIPLAKSLIQNGYKNNTVTLVILISSLMISLFFFYLHIKKMKTNGISIVENKNHKDNK